MDAELPGHFANKLLKALPRKEFDRLLPHLEYAQFAQGEVLYEPVQELSEVYFILSGMVS